MKNELKEKICYFCGKPATSKEHAPALCFFPDSKRNNLTKVDSCYDHNEKTSLDDEYVRNIILKSIIVAPCFWTQKSVIFV